LNLAVNARDAMPNGGKLTIETTNADVEGEAGDPTIRPGRYVRLAVSDTGCGMSQETVAQIFQPFFTTKEEGKGTGLGLAIAYGVVKQNSGFVKVESEVGRGSKFNIFLPEATKQGATAISPSGISDLNRRRSGTVLIVEDEPSLRALVRESLLLSGYKVLEAGDGEEALMVMDTYSAKIDLVISDVVMPRMGGLELAEKLSTVRPNMRVLLTSGYTDRLSDLEKSKRPLLQKPFTPDQLLNAVGALFDVAATPS
jgi:two-component system cell cycle sensor histidine kinase/response regulator CckA